ncbi:Protein MAIN-LIKE 2 [Glycine max]|nr:Protein MAIN-LIKE 2 [Glycine max]
MFARAWILRFIGGVLLVDKSSKRVPMRYLQFLVAFEGCSTYAWGAAATDYNVQSIGSYILLIQLWAWERCPKLVPSIVPPQQQNNPLGYRWLENRNSHMANDSVEHYRFKLDTMKKGDPDKVMRQFGLQQPIPGPSLQPSNIHGLTLKEKSGHNWRRLQQTLSEWNSRYERRFQETPPQVGPFSGEIIETMQFMLSPYRRRVSNLDDLAPCLDKMTLLTEEEDKIIEAREEAPSLVPQFERQQFDMLGRSVETQGLGQRRESVDAEAHVIPAMPERQHGMYYTPDQFTQEPSQMSSLYPYPYQSGTSSDAYFIGTQPPLQPGYVMADLFGSLSPAGTPSFAHGCQISTPNAPMGPPWTVSGNIPNITDLLGIDFGNQFSVKADERKGDRRRNPD